MGFGLFLHRFFRIACLVVLLAAQFAPAVGGFQQANGIVVETVGAATRTAGVHAGDVLLSWSRGPARGTFASVFDLNDVETEQLPLGEITLNGTRQGKPFSATVAAVDWGITARPHIPDSWLPQYLEARRLLQAGDTPKGTALLRTVVDGLPREQSPQAAAALLRALASALNAAKQYEPAQRTYDEAIALAVGPRAHAWLLHQKGRALSRRNDFAGAEAALDRMLTLARGGAAGPLTEAVALNELGAVSYLRGDLDTAAKRFEGVVAIREKAAPGSLVFAESLNNLGLISMDRGDLARADALYARALAIKERLVPGTMNLASTLNNLAMITYQRGDLEQASELHRRALAIEEQRVPEGLEVASTVNDLGNVALAAGELATAEQYYDRALAIRQRLAAGSPALADSYNNRGVVAKERGDLAAAEGYARAGLEIRQKVVPGSLAEAVSLSNLGVIAFQRGDLERAEHWQRAAWTIVEKRAPESLQAARVLNNLGAIAAERGARQEAEDLLARSLAIKEKRAPDSFQVASTLTQLGTLAAERGDWTKAEALQRRALAIRERLGPNGLPVAETLMALAQTAEERGDAAAARPLYERAAKITQALAPDSSVAARILHREGVLAFRGGRLTEAAALLAKAVRTLEAQIGRLGGAEEVQAAFTARHADLYRDYIAVLLAQGDPAAAFAILERSRAQQLLRLIAERDLVFSDVPPELDRGRKRNAAEYDAAQARLAELDPAQHPEAVAKSLAALATLREERDALSSRLKEASPRFAALHYPEPLDLAAARRALERGTLLLAYSVGRTETILFVVEPPERRGPGIHVFRLPVTEADLRGRVAAYRGAIERGARHASADTAAPARALYRDLLGPARALIDGAQRLLISPDGPLHSLPFAALATNTSGRPRYLIEEKPLHMIVSATVYQELRRDGSGARVADGRPTVVAFGDPAYVTAGTPGAIGTAGGVRRAAVPESLPASRVEVQAIRRLFGSKAATFLGESATEDAAKGVGAEVDILHFAVHGIVDERFPLNSALLLSTHAAARSPEQNGALQAWEVFEQLRLDARLVTLSACETGLGRELGGEGLLGLTRAFQYAGARAVVASLWSVADTSTAKLMERFYAHLRAGQPIDDALRSAQLELARDPAYAHPFHWAAFTLQGRRR